MQPLKKQVEGLREGVEAAVRALDLASHEQELTSLDQQLADPEVWQDNEKAQHLAKKAAKLRAEAEPWQAMTAQLNDLTELLALDDTSMQAEIAELSAKLELEFEQQQKHLMFQGKYDRSDVILRLSAGVGGTDAQDWTEMLERMYLRWAESHKMKTALVERSTGEEAGIKSSVIEISGPFAFGKLKSEHGVHRLVRLSPFNSDNLRQTSFALVEILPQIDRPEDATLESKDLKVDVYRSGGHGGQSVNTTDSAVRITHLPTGIVVAIQNERSQIQNRETAMKVLRAKLVQLQLEQHAETISDLQAGESANWGSQIRNYVLHPYTMVKDTRTKYEEHDAAGVLDGKLDGFIEAYLEHKIDK